MKTRSVTTATIVGHSHPLRAEELARACSADLAWVARLVEVGIVPARGAQPGDWRFHSADLQRALTARRLERDFDAGLDLAALILDLSEELRRLKARLRALNGAE